MYQTQLRKNDSVTTWIALKNVKKIHLAKINFRIHRLNMKLVIKIRNMLLMYGKHLKKMGKMIMICI